MYFVTFCRVQFFVVSFVFVQSLFLSFIHFVHLRRTGRLFYNLARSEVQMTMVII